MPKLLLIDDDKETLSINKRFLTKAGYEVKAVTDTITGIHLLTDYHPDCIILDIMMPDIDGFEASTYIRSKTRAPFIYLSGCTQERDKIKGFQLGADDYITKPYSLKELQARIGVQIRRHSTTSKKEANIITSPPLSLNLVLHKAYYNQEEIPLSNREFELLYLLISNPNQVLSFETIGNHMFGVYSDSDRRSIMVTASRLRKKLDQWVGISDFVETVWSKGYKFNTKMR